MAKSNTPLIIGVSAAALLGIIALTASGSASAAGHANCFRIKNEKDEEMGLKKFESFSQGMENDTYFALGLAASGSNISDSKLFSLMCDVAKKVPRFFGMSADKSALITQCPGTLDPIPQYICGPKQPDDIKCGIGMFYKDNNGAISEVATDTFTTTEEGLKADILQSLKENMVKPAPPPPPTPKYNPTSPYAASASVCYTVPGRSRCGGRISAHRWHQGGLYDHSSPGIRFWGYGHHRGLQE